MGLIANQYKEQGGAIIGRLEERQANERAKVLEGLGQKKSDMLHMYSEARGLLADTANDLKENSISQFEHEWRKTQENIAGEISEGRRGSDR